MEMRSIHGHYSELKDDIDSIYYEGYSVWLYLHKKSRHLSHMDKVIAVQCMQQMRIKIPKRIRREMRRLRKSSLWGIKL